MVDAACSECLITGAVAAFIRLYQNMIIQRAHAEVGLRFSLLGVCLVSWIATICHACTCLLAIARAHLGQAPTRQVLVAEDDDHIEDEDGENVDTHGHPDPPATWPAKPGSGRQLHMRSA